MPSITRLLLPISYRERDSRVTEYRCEIQGSQQSRGPQALTGTSFPVFSWQSPRCQEDGVCQGPSSQRGAQRALPPSPDLTKSGCPGNCSPSPISTSDTLGDHELCFPLTEARVKPEDPSSGPPPTAEGRGDELVSGARPIAWRELTPDPPGCRAGLEPRAPQPSSASIHTIPCPVPARCCHSCVASGKFPDLSESGPVMPRCG